MDDICQVKEPECAFFMAGNKLDVIQSLYFSPYLVFMIELKPMDPQYIHVCQLSQTRVQDCDLVDTKDLCIYIWVGWVSMRESHHLWTTPYVALVSLSQEVTCCIVDDHCIPLLKAVAMDIDFVALSIHEAWQVRMVLPVEDSGKEVICQLQNEVLMGAVLQTSGIKQNRLIGVPLTPPTPAPFPLHPPSSSRTNIGHQHLGDLFWPCLQFNHPSALRLGLAICLVERVTHLSSGDR